MNLSIVITAFNYASYLEKSIESCLLQNSADWEYEVIVVDDGSTDETPEIMSKWNDPRLKKFRIVNSGIERASNFGFEKASGDFIVRLDADDILNPNYIRDIRPYISGNFAFFYSDYAVINADGKIIKYVSLPEFNSLEIYQRGDFLASGTLYSAKVLKDAGGYSITNRNSGLENYELILSLIKSGVKGLHIPKSLFCYRRHDMNLSIAKKEKIIAYGESLFSRLGLGMYSTNEFHRNFGLPEVNRRKQLFYCTR